MPLDATSSSTLEKVRIRIAEMGPHFNQAILRDTRALYQPLLPKTSERVRVQQDVSYAPDDRQCLDLYAPAEAAGLPILIAVAMVTGASTGSPRTMGEAPLAWKPNIRGVCAAFPALAYSR